MTPGDPELDALRADLDRTPGLGRWRCWRSGGLLYAWLMPPTTPQVLLSGRTPAAVEARIMRFNAVLASPDRGDPRSAARQAREAAEDMDVSEYETE